MSYLNSEDMENILACLKGVSEDEREPERYRSSYENTYNKINELKVNKIPLLTVKEIIDFLTEEAKDFYSKGWELTGDGYHYAAVAINDKVW